jgi:hypothetical protein
MRDTAKLSGRALKRKVADILQTENFDEMLSRVSPLPARQVVNPLISLLLSNDEKIKWRAVSALGAVVANLANQDRESARVIMRRLMWMLNDESGGIGWGAAEAMGEIIAAHDGLAKEYAPVLISYVWEDGNFLEYEPLQRGAVWGLGRVAQVKPALVQGSIPHLISFLESSDNTVRGLAAWALGLLGAQAARPKLEGLLHDDSEIPLYADRKLSYRRISDLAKDALAAITVYSNSQNNVPLSK